LAKRVRLEEWLSTGNIKQTGKWLNAPKGKWLRDYLFEKQRGCCSVCGNASWNGKGIPLQLDHINGDIEDNSPSNLHLVCPNCDAQSEFYKAKNKGRGRTSRLKRLRSHDN